MPPKVNPVGPRTVGCFLMNPFKSLGGFVHAENFKRAVKVARGGDAGIEGATQVGPRGPVIVGFSLQAAAQFAIFINFEYLQMPVSILADRELARLRCRLAAGDQQTQKEKCHHRGRPIRSTPIHKIKQGKIQGALLFYPTGGLETSLLSQPWL